MTIFSGCNPFAGEFMSNGFKLAKAGGTLAY